MNLLLDLCSFAKERKHRILIVNAKTPRNVSQLSSLKGDEQ